MERRRKPPHGAASCCVQECACDQGYIVERVVSNRRCRTCFEGGLYVHGLPRGLRGPLALCSAEVIRIDAVQNCDAPACQSVCDSPRCGRVGLTLLCCVEDACGCRAEGTARIEVEDCCAPILPQLGCNLRRGASVRVAHARFCPPCGFDVCLEIELCAVISRSELMGGVKKPCPVCPQLPLYPQPRRDFT